MPTYEYSNLNKEKPVGGSADKIMALFNTSGDDDIISRSNRVVISLKTSEAFETSLRSMPSPTYNLSAGSNLSNIFMPYQAKIDPLGLDMPSIHPSASGLFPSGTSPCLKDLMPFMFDPRESGVIFDRTQAASGDGLGGLISGEEYFGHGDRFRDGGDVRGIGLRLPLIGVGWGFDLDGNPFPSGVAETGPNSSGTHFAGGYDSGWQVDPKNYVAAPIDFRYDKDRHVWATTSDASFYARVLATSGVYTGPSGSRLLLRTAHSWLEIEFSTSGTAITKTGGKRGSFTTNPAYEVNGLRTNIGNIIKLESRGKDNNSYIFRVPIPGEVGSFFNPQRYNILSILDDVFTVGFDVPRFS
jgi:hypothetical protein